MGEWFCYNFAARSFHTKTLCSKNLFDWNWILFKKSFLKPPFGELWGNICTPSITRWKARDRLPIRRNWTFFAISYDWDVISGNLSKSTFFKGGSLWVQISDGRGRRPPTTVGIRKLECLPFGVVSQYPQCIVWFCHKARVWQTDRRNYDFKDCASIAVSHVKNW